MKTDPLAGIQIAERHNCYGPSSDAIIASVFKQLHPWEKKAPTRKQFAAAARYVWKDAFIYVGGHHVAVHFACCNERNLLFVAPSIPDWN